MKNVRECHYHHPIFGVMRKDLESNYYNTEGNLYIPEGIELETIYERDRRLWVEQAISMELTNQGVLLTDTQIEHRAKYYLKAYDLIQNVIFQNQ
jgi:hypothetical protein